MTIRKPVYKAAGKQLTWDDLDKGDGLTGRQRGTVDIIIALIEDETTRRGVDRLAMLDFIAGFILYETFGSGRVNAAAVTHAENIMEIADHIDELCSE